MNLDYKNGCSAIINRFKAITRRIVHNDVIFDKPFQIHTSFLIFLDQGHSQIHTMIFWKQDIHCNNYGLIALKNLITKFKLNVYLHHVFKKPLATPRSLTRLVHIKVQHAHRVYFILYTLHILNIGGGEKKIHMITISQWMRDTLQFTVIIIMLSKLWSSQSISAVQYIIYFIYHFLIITFNKKKKWQVPVKTVSWSQLWEFPLPLQNHYKRFQAIWRNIVHIFPLYNACHQYCKLYCTLNFEYSLIWMRNKRAG